MEKIVGQRFEKQRFADTSIENIIYDDCVFHNCKFQNVKWINCSFKNTSILGKSKFENCKFESCKFLGQHTNLGGPTIYSKCEFNDIEFKNIQLWNTEFIDCFFTGKAENIVLYGKDAPKGWETIFKNVDIQGLVREFVDFRCEFDLSKTKI